MSGKEDELRLFAVRLTKSHTVVSRKKGPADIEVQCVGQKGKKIDSQKNVACFEISFILLT